MVKVECPVRTYDIALIKRKKWAEMTHSFSDMLKSNKRKFQWSKVASVLGDYKDFIHAYNLSIQSAGFSMGQIEAQLDTISKRFEQLKATITGVFNNAGTSGLSRTIKDTIVSINYFFRSLQSISHETYSFMIMLGKMAVVLIGGGMAFKAVASSVINVRNAINAARGATVANTAATVADTTAQGANNIARQVGTATAGAEATATAVATVAQQANAVATTEAAVATSAWATAMTIATAGINIILALLAVATAAFFGYNSVMGESIALQDKEKEALENKEQARRQEIEMMKKQNHFIGVLGEQHIKLTNAINSNTLSEEKNKKAKEDLEATDKELAKIVGEDGLERIKTSDNVSAAIKEEQKAHAEKTKAIKQEMIDIKTAQIEYTQNEIAWAEKRVESLGKEIDAWDYWARTKKFAMNLQGDWATMMANLEKAKGNTGMAESFEQMANDAYGYNPNEDKIEEYKASILKNKAELARLQGELLPLINTTYGNPDNDSGELPDGSSPADSTKGTTTGTSHTGTQVQNSPQRMAYDFLMKQGLTQGMVLGLMGNIDVESGFNPNAQNGQYYGLLQWDSNRQQALKKFANDIHGDMSNAATQLAFIVYELKNIEKTAYNKVLEKSNTPEEYAHNLDQYYVRSDHSTSWQRQQNARAYYDKYAIGSGNKKNYDDPMQQLHEGFEALLKNFKTACEEGKQKAIEIGRSWTSLDQKILFDRIFGENGSNIDYSKGITGVSDVGKSVADSASKHPTGEQFFGTVTKNPTIQCDSFTAKVYNDAGVKSIGGYDTNATINDDAFRAANALHNYSDVTNGTYKPQQGDMLGWRWSASSGHYGVYDPVNNVVSTRDSGDSGVKHRTLEQAIQTWGTPTWIGSLTEALKSPKSIVTGTQSTSPFAIDEAYKKERASVYGNSTKDKQELFDLDQRLKQAKSDASVEWIHKIEKDIDEIRKNGLPLPKSYREIYQLREKSKTQTGVSAITGYASKEKMTTDIAEYQKIATLRKTAEQTAIKAVETHTKALESMAEKELAFAKKLGLVTNQDMLKRNIRKNETSYAEQSAKVDEKLSKSAYSGKEAEMLAEYNNLLMAQSELESKQAVDHMMLLSMDVEATSKAIEEKMALDQKYYEAKYNYEQQAFEYQNRYTISILDNFTSGWQTAFENTLNKTKSFAENMQDIFKSMWQGVVKLFANDITTKMHKTIATAVFGNKENGYKAGAMQGHIGSQEIPSSGSKLKLPSLKSIFGGSKKSKSSTSSLADFGADTLGSGLSLLNFGSSKKSKGKGSNSFTFDTKMFDKSIKKASSSWKSFQNTMSTSMQATKQTCNMAVSDMANTAVQADNTKQTSSSTTAAAVQADAQATQTAVSAQIGSMVTQMLAAMAIMWAMSALFGGGGSSTSTSTSEVNLGRSPDSYYMTPTAVSQSTSYTVPSMDIGGNIEKDMLIYAHKNEMVLTPEQAGVIRSVASHGGANGSGGSNSNAHVRSNINVSTVDSKGFDRVLRNYNRDLSKQVKKGIRNGYLTANGLV